MPRAIAQGSAKFGKNVSFKYTDFLQNTTLVVSKATGVDTTAKTVTLENGEKLEYDFLVVSTGVSYETFKGNGSPTTVEARRAQYDEEAERCVFVCVCARLCV